MSGEWASARLPASFRGVPFVILENQLKRGRQLAMHVYPFRDDPWPEDLGRSPRITSFRGFVVGDFADDNIADLIAAAEQAGPGLLVHPTLGAFSAQVLQFTCSDSATAGRVWSFEMTVVPFIERIYPISADDTQAQTRGLLGRMGDAIGGAFADAQTAIRSVRNQVGGVVQTVQLYSAQAQSLMHDATTLANLPTGLVGNYGRFAGGSRAVSINSASTFTTFAQASGKLNGGLSAVSRISGTLSGLAARL